MSSHSAESTTSRHRVALAIGIVVLSIALPTGLIGWSVAAALRDKPILGRPSNVFKIYQGAVKDGELWFSETRMRGTAALPLFDCRIKRLDLQTGAERDTGLMVPNDDAYSIRLGEKLYVLTSARIYEVVGTSLVEIARLLPRGAPVNSSLFLHDDHLTTVRETDDGGICLTHLIDGQWKDGRLIVLPGPDRVWRDDQQRQRQVLLPLASQQLAPKGRAASQFLHVVRQEQQYHLMLTNHNGFAAYRTGFEFADEASDGASALAPENAPREVSGWEPIGPLTTTNDRWNQMTGSHDGLLFISWGSPQRIVRRTSEGHWKELTVSDGKSAQANWIMSDPSQSTVYFIKENQLWSSAEVGRIEGDIVQPIHLVAPGCEVEYLGRWRRVLTGALLAWLLHVVVLVGGAEWLTRGAVPPEYGFGNQRATLAPLWRRAIATGADAALLATAVVCFERFLVVVIGIQRSGRDELARAHDLFAVEQALYGVFSGTPLAGRGPGTRSAITSPLNSSLDVFALFIALLLVICIAKVFFEGRYGITPGKWMLGLRTVRATLRPCGFARALVRNLLYYVDLPLLLTPLPAAISLMFSDHCQRLGDRVADTIVVRAGSVREAC